MEWESVAAIMGAVVAVPYVIGPLMVKATMKFNPRPRLRQIDPAREQIPSEVRSYGFDIHEQFTRLGFDPGPLVKIEGIVPNVHCYAAMYSRRSDGQQAMAAVNFAQVQGKTNAKPGYVEFSSDFKGGVAVMTNNSNDVPFGPKTADAIVVKAPWARSVAQLLDLHKEACRRHGVGEMKRDTGEQWAERAIFDSMDKFVSRGVAHGFMCAGAGGVYVLTWKGAVIGAITNLWPGSWIVRQRANRAAKELMRFVPGKAEFGR